MMLPLSGLRVVEFSQMVMGPCCGMILADLGAEVIKIEPLPKGDRTRFLGGMGSGFFPAFSRNKKSVAVDMSSEKGRELVRRIVDASDILIENFRPGRMASFKLDYASLSARNPRLVYCSMKGFLPGPYEDRTALDEVVQMMGGLAFMTGLPGKPMRAGASVNDIMGAMFAVIAIQGALRAREETGQGQEVISALFENNAFLMAPIIITEAVTGVKAVPWSVKTPPWPVYDLFDTEDGKQIFIAIVGDQQWRDFCAGFGMQAWLDDPELATNADRTARRNRLIPEIRRITVAYSLQSLSRKLEEIGLPFAPVHAPGDLVEDRHLIDSGGLVELKLPGDATAKIPGLPIMFGRRRLTKRSDAPQMGEHSLSVLHDVGLAQDDIDALLSAGVVAQGNAG